VSPSPKNFEELLSEEGIFLVAMCKDRGREGILEFGFLRRSPSDRS